VLKSWCGDKTGGWDFSFVMRLGVKKVTLNPCYYLIKTDENKFSVKKYSRIVFSVNVCAFNGIFRKSSSFSATESIFSKINN
jgi:hypothetical protein